MKLKFKFFLALLLGAAAAFTGRAQQQPVLTVDITNVSVFTGQGSVCFIDLLDAGSGYATVPTVTISAPTGPDPVQAQAVATITADGAIANIRVTIPGSGYTSAPTITITGGGGTGARATARLGDYFSPPNEAFGPARTTIGITAQAIGTFVNSSYTYSFFVNGVSIGVTTAPVPPTAPPPTVFWAPPQPGSYFITVTATDGVSTSTSLAVRYFATGTVVNSPLTNTFVPQGSSVVLKADATVANGFIREIQFYDNGSPIGTPDRTIPYSYVYSVPGAIGTTHNITARAVDSTGVTLDSQPITLRVVAAITPLPTSVISTPADGAIVPIPTGSSPTPIPITVDATSHGGLISKVETYIDGVLFGTKNTFPYTFPWTPTIVGTYRIVALTYDDKNNVIASGLSAITIAAPPSIAITSPANGSTVTGGSPATLSATATDSNADANGNPLTISSVQFFVDGAFVGSATTPTSGNTYSVKATLSQKKDKDGNPVASVITALATDSGGITAPSAPVNITVTSGGGDSGSVIGNPPTVNVTWPATGTLLPVNAPLVVTAKASDTDGNIVSVQFFANNTSIGSTVKYPYTTDWTPGSLGAYALTAKATDSDGNVVTSIPLNVTVVDPSPNPPSVAISSPANGATVGVGSAQTLRATATDAVSVKSVQFYVNGQPEGEAITAYPFITSWSPTTPGVYTITARAVNASGNQAVSPAVLVVVAETASGASVFTGNYQGLGETGNFAVTGSINSKATFLAYSTTGTKKTYRYTDVPVDAAGGFTLSDAAGKSLLAGSASATGVNGTFDGGRLTFIGVDTSYFPAASPVATGYYTGKLTAHSASSLVALVGSDGSILIQVQDGSFDDAGSGKVDSVGAFNLTSVRGNRFTGTVDPTTHLLSGTLSGAGGGDFTGAQSSPAGASVNKVTGFAKEVGSDIYVASNGKIYDQVLLQGVSASVAADPGQITRMSYVDLSNDVVQIEFSGAGRLSVTLDNASGPAVALNYNQSDVLYMKGHANIVITGADESTNVSVFTVGKLTAVNQSLLKSGLNYDGVADIGYVAILSDNGKFGGIRTANASYLASQGITGICAPGVQVVGPVYVGDINAADAANPMLLTGSAGEVQINGGDLWQSNGRSVQVSGVTQLKFVDGTTSQGSPLPAQVDQSRLEQDGIDVTTKVVVNPR